MNKDDKFICNKCKVELDSIYDYLVHIEVIPEVLIKLSNSGLSIDLWRVLEEIYYLADEGKTEDIKAISESLGFTLYSLKTGLLHEELDELIVERSLENLDKELKELLDE